MENKDLHNHHQEIGERELLARVARNDQQAFGKIVLHYSPIIYRQFVSVIRDTHLAQELTQDTLMVLWRRREKLADMDNFGGYVYVIVRNKVQKALKEALLSDREIPQDEIQAVLDTPATSMEAKELKRLLNQGIAQLPARRQEVFRLSRQNNMTFDQIADELGISRSTVKHQVIAAIVFLKEYLRRKGDVVIAALTWLIPFLR